MTEKLQIFSKTSKKLVSSTEIIIFSRFILNNAPEMLGVSELGIPGFVYINCAYFYFVFVFYAT
jgi:hypothetical protein